MPPDLSASLPARCFCAQLPHAAGICHRQRPGRRINLPLGVSRLFTRAAAAAAAGGSGSAAPAATYTKRQIRHAPACLDACTCDHCSATGTPIFGGLSLPHATLTPLDPDHAATPIALYTTDRAPLSDDRRPTQPLISDPCTVWLPRSSSPPSAWPCSAPQYARLCFAALPHPSASPGLPLGMVLTKSHTGRHRRRRSSRSHSGDTWQGRQEGKPWGGVVGAEGQQTKTGTS